MKLLLSEITLAEDINARQGLHEETVERYAEILDSLPPIEVWRANGSLLLVDGWHRLAAAHRLGREGIEAEVREGDRTGAMIAAITANTHHGLPFSTAERDRAIARLAAAGWSKRRIARELGLSEVRVRAILGAAHLGAHLPFAIRDSAVRAPQEYRLPLAEAAGRSGWSQRETREVARRLADPTIGDEVKRAIVGQHLAPDEQGRPSLPVELVLAALAEAREHSATPALHGFLAAAAELLGKLKSEAEPLSDLPPDDRAGVLHGLDLAEEASERVRELLA